MLLSTVYGMSITVPAVADDIEIYTTAGSITQQTQPNVLFVLDTSGSMGSTVMTRDPYDPATTYVAPGCYDSTRVYLQPQGSNNAHRHCNGGSSTGWGWWRRTYTAVSNLGQANRTAVVCDAAKSLDSTGYFTGRLSQYRSNWSDSLTSGDVTNFVECQGDQGVHGETTGDSRKWASTSNGPWSSVEAEKLNWGNIGFSATIYSGNYLNYLISTPLTNAGTRISVMQDVISDLVTNTTDINIGLMRFSNDSDGGMVAEPIDDIENNRTAFISALNAMTDSGGTPLSETYYESVMYYQGNSVDYGTNSQPFASVASSRSGGSYVSPIANECQKNFTILLTDGDPTNDSLNGTRLAKLGVSSCSGNCLDEIAEAIGTNDQSSSLSGDQVISTYTIGFAIDKKLLEDTANASLNASGTGEYLLADDANTLADAFNAILVDINNSDTTFSSPAVSVNAFNRSTHLNDLYFTLFKPGKGARWAGNLKKYKLDFFVDANDIDGDSDITEKLPYIADANGANAVDPVTGFFGVGAESYWTHDGADGLDVSAGGAANELVSPRKVYTYSSTYTNTNGVLQPVASSAALTANVNAVDKNNADITNAMLDILSAPEKIPGTPRRETLLDWAAGLDVFDQYGVAGTSDARLEMGDPLHSEPALVQYGESSPGVADLVAYMATNEGYLHAIDADDGTEIFSFIPQELLANLNDLMDNKQGSKTYGLDGNVVAWVNDANGDNTISGGADHVYLYIGMRRGGNNIYSLDVTDRNNPRLRWIIKGGSGDYAELGQTWSTVNVEKIKDGNTEKTVLIFGGGYDTAQDSATVRTTDSVGRAVYIADADTGELLWSAGNGGTLPVADMDYSIPARIKPLDMSGDGFIDRLYAADMGGQIFRFDIDNDNGSALASSINGGRIADLADNGKANARRFYYPPDVALIAKRGEAAYLALVASSGYRAHPLDTEIQDRIYLLKDNDVYNTPTAYTTLTEADLYDATLNLVAGDGTDAQNVVAKTALDNSEGWYIKLDDGAGNWNGEKGLAEPLIIEGTAIVTTFIPVGTSVVSGSCVPQAGSGRVFYLDVFDGSAAFPSALDKRTERTSTLARSGIPPSPNTIITPGGEPTLCIGTECSAADFGLGARKTHWYEVE